MIAHSDSASQRVRRLLLAAGLACITALASAAPEVALSTDAAALVAEVTRSNDHGDAPFLVLDKRAAWVWVFDARGRSTGSAPVLLGLAIGDDTAPGIAELPLAQITDAARTTPAGRFVIEPGRNLHGDDILWIDYEAAVSMHRVRSVNAGERRLQRLASPRAADRRISKTQRQPRHGAWIVHGEPAWQLPAYTRQFGWNRRSLFCLSCAIS